MIFMNFHNISFFSLFPYLHSRLSVFSARLSAFFTKIISVVDFRRKSGYTLINRTGNFFLPFYLIVFSILVKERLNL